MPAAHDQGVTHRYRLHIGPHEPREGDPHYHLFEAYKRAHKHKDARCYVGERIGFEHCHGDLELHHAHLEFSDIDSAKLEAVQRDFPDVRDEEGLKTWAESDANFRWLCSKHHRSSEAGAHSLAHADFEASCYVPTLTD